MEKIVIDIVSASDEAIVHNLLVSYHSGNLEQFPKEVCCYKNKQLIDIIDKEYKDLASIDENWVILDIGEVEVKQAKKNLEYAKYFLNNPPEEIKGRKPIIISDMPDYLTDEELHQYFGWELSTIASKRSRGELPQVNGLRLTPKEELINYLTSRTIGSSITNSQEEKQKAVDDKIASFKRK